MKSNIENNKLFNNIKILPFTELLDNPIGLSFHKGGPVWPEWEREISCRHCRGGIPKDVKPEYDNNTIFETVEEPLYWCGPIVLHFGHQIADFSTRIASYDISKKEFLYCFAVHPRSNIVTVEDTPVYFREILEWFNIPLERVKIISKPILAKSLVCVPQQEQLANVSPHDDYLDKLDMNVAKNLDIKRKSGIYYISRAGFKTGTIAGEAYLEYILGMHGVKVIRPETISLKEQLRIYYTAKKIIFSEGSAIHTLQLLGRNISQVYIINRRPNTTLAKQLLAKRCEILQYFDCGELVYGLNRIGKPAPEIGLTIPDKNLLLNIFQKIGIKISDWNDTIFENYIKESISLWKEKEEKSLRSNVIGSREMILEKLRSIGY